jgi:PAS domain S-box-containing protein
MAIEELPFVEVAQRSRLPLLLTDPSMPGHPIVYANRAFLKLTRYNLDEVIGRNCRFLQGSDTDPTAVQRIREAIADGLEIHQELLNYRKDGSPFWNELFMTPLTDEEGRITYFLGSQLDVTARVHAHVAVQRTRDELARRLLEREALVREIQHRVRNNLQLLLTIVRLQAGENLPTTEPWHEAMARRILALAAAQAPFGDDGFLSSIDLGVALASLVSLVATKEQRVAISTDRMSGNIDTVIALVLMAGEMLAAISVGDIELSLRANSASNSVVLQVRQTRGAEIKGQRLRSPARSAKLSGTGLLLVRSLTDQFGGTLRQRQRMLTVELPGELFQEMSWT